MERMRHIKFIRHKPIIPQAGQTLGYQISKHNIPEVWKKTQGEGVKVAILDTGCQAKHADLRGSVKFGLNISGFAEYKKWDDLYRRTGNADHKRKRDRAKSDYMDRDGHGTHVSGILSANNNALGIVGVAPEAQIYVYKVLGDDGYGSYEDVALGIHKALSKGVDVISMSLGGDDNHSGVYKAIQAAYVAHVPVVCAAGNEGNRAVLGYPAQYAETISIGALDMENIRAVFSNMGQNLDFMAPGVDILSTVPSNRYAVYSGTSMSTPWAAGVIALMIAKHRKYGGRTPVRTVEDVREHLSKTAVDLDAAGKDKKTGYGLIDVRALLADPKPKPEPKPEPTPDPRTPYDPPIEGIVKRLERIEERLTKLENKQSGDAV